MATKKSRLTGGVKSWSNVVNPRSCGLWRCYGTRCWSAIKYSDNKKPRMGRGVVSGVSCSQFDGMAHNLFRTVCHFHGNARALQQVVRLAQFAIIEFPHPVIARRAIDQQAANAVRHGGRRHGKFPLFPGKTLDDLSGVFIVKGKQGGKDVLTAKYGLRKEQVHVCRQAAFFQDNGAVLPVGKIGEFSLYVLLDGLLQSGVVIRVERFCLPCAGSSILPKVTALS